MSIMIVLWSAVIGIGFGIVATICFLWWMVCREEQKRAKRRNCQHINYYYADMHPEKVWRCNDCGIDF